MRIRVEVKNEILGNSIFWEGDENDINNIRNLVARQLAKNIIKPGVFFGVTQKHGMWHVSMVQEKNGI